MVWLLVGLAVFFSMWGFTWWLAHKNCESNGLYFYCYGHPLVGVISAITGLVVWLSLASWYASTIPESEKWSVTHDNLAVLNDGSRVNGSFFLGSGTIDSDPSFMFYTESDGNYKLKQVYAEDSIVRYSTESPKIEYHSPKSRFWTYWNMNNQYYVFKVPNGSIKYGYELDAK
jgi:hypothetical protein